MLYEDLRGLHLIRWAQDRAAGAGGGEHVGPASSTPHVFCIRKLELTLRFCQPPPQLSPALPIMHRGRNELPWASARSLPSAVIYRKRPMIYGPVISQWSCSLSFARPPDPAATPSQVGEMCANHTLWGLLNRRSWAGGGAGRGAANRGPLMKLIFNSMCILMKQAGLGDDTRPPLRDANEAVSRSEDSSNTGAPSPRHALIYEWNAPLGASDPRDVLKDLYSVGSELVKQTARPCRLFTCNHRYDLITSERLSVALTTIIICTCLLLDMVSSPPNFNTAAEHMFSGGSRDLREFSESLF